MNWISTKDRLPDDMNYPRVLVTSEGGVCEAFFNKWEGYFETDEYGMLEDVTAWMPLPEPYSEPDRYFVRTTYIGNGVSDYEVKDRSQGDKPVFQSNVWNESKAVSNALNKLHSEKS